jgi:hypothetical protein
MKTSTDQKILFIDCQLAGISGDKVVAALLDLGAGQEKVINAVRETAKHVQDCDGIDVTVAEASRCGFRAKQIIIAAKEKRQHRSGLELISATIDSAKALNLSSEAQSFAEKAIRTLVGTEARLHGESIKNVHLHEAGSVDTVADIIGTAAALDDLKIFCDSRVYSSPVAVGGGLFQFSHGTVVSPAPATLEILKECRFKVFGGPLDFELSTPTGVSILTSLAETSLDHLPSMSPEAVGYGAGDRHFDTVPNILRIIMGRTPDLTGDQVILMETNLDDVTGETIGYASERLLAAGAKDVSITPIFGKKGRPGWVISIIADQKDAETLADILTSETGTLGLRILPSHRMILMRENMKVEGEIYGNGITVDVKVARDRSGKITILKPEYDDVRELALRLGRPFRKIHDEVTELARKKLGLK